MKSPAFENPFDMLISALGGRRLFAQCWMLWLFATIIVYYAQVAITMEPLHARIKLTYSIAIFGFTVYLLLIIRDLASKERRSKLLSVSRELPSVSVILRILIYSVPILSLGAALSPVIYK